MLHLLAAYTTRQFLKEGLVADAEGLAHVHLAVPFRAAAHTVPGDDRRFIAGSTRFKRSEREEDFESRSRQETLGAAVAVVDVHALVRMVAQYKAGAVDSVCSKLLSPVGVLHDADILTAGSQEQQRKK
nr:Unknown Function [uncultured bacterium]